MWGCNKMNRTGTGPPNSHINAAGRGGHCCFNGLHMHPNEKRMCRFIICKHLWSTFGPLWRVSPTHVLGHQNTHIISEALNNSDKWLQVNWSCKSHCCTLYGLHTLPQLGSLPSDVCGCVTSPAWFHVSLSAPQTQARVSNTSVGRPSPMSRNSNCDRLYTVHYTIFTKFCDVIVYASGHTEQNSLCYKLWCPQNSLPFIQLGESASAILLFFFFFQNPLLKECHSCSANTEYVFECILSPALIPLPILAWRAHLQPVLYWHADKAETPDEGLSAQQYTECTIWPASLINVLYLQSSIVQNRHWVRKTSYWTQPVAVVCKVGWVRFLSQMVHICIYLLLHRIFFWQARVKKGDESSTGYVDSTYALQDSLR